MKRQLLKYTLIIVLGLLNIPKINAQTAVFKSCSKCKNKVSIYSKVGDKCPYCGVIWGRENQFVNTLTTVDKNNEINSNKELKVKDNLKVLNRKHTIHFNKSKKPNDQIVKLNSFLQFCGLNNKSTTQNVYQIFGKPTDIKESIENEVWFYDIEKFSIGKSNKKILFTFNNITKLLSGYTLVLDFSIPNNNETNLRVLFDYYLKNEQKLELVFKNKFDFDKVMGLPDETVNGEYDLFTRYSTNDLYIDVDWKKENFHSDFFNVVFKNP